MCLLFFFFQAEDGIRDLVRSRGLGDVYKRQRIHLLTFLSFKQKIGAPPGNSNESNSLLSKTAISVSYTHLTLPTSDLV